MAVGLAYCLSVANGQSQEPTCSQPAERTDPWQEWLTQWPKAEASCQQVKLRVGGLEQADAGWINDDGAGQFVSKPLEDKVQWRRLRLYVLADLADWLGAKVEADFAPQTPRPTLLDAYVQVRRLPVVGDITVGRFKEPFGLDQLTSAADITFMERGLPDAFAPAWNFGVRDSNYTDDQRMTWAVGLFKNSDGYCAGDPTQGNACALTGRMTFLPQYARDGAELVHLGGAYSLRFPNEPVSFSQRPEAHFAPNFTSTGDIDTNRLQLLGLEAAWVKDAFSIQAEYSAAGMHSTNAGDLYLQGAYIYASYFLTGEHRPYDRKAGVFTSVIPNRPLFVDGGWGAWELAGRYSFLDLRQGSLPSGARLLQDFTFGLNWYLNANVRLEGNYVRSYLNGNAADAADIFIVRLQIAF